MKSPHTIITDVYGVDWCYIQIPRTASKAYTSLLNKEFADNLRNNKYYPMGHAPYFMLRKTLDPSVKYFSVVRHPVLRFASSLKYIFQRQYEYIKHIIPHDNVSNIVNFLYDAFDTNFAPELHWFIPGFFKTQVFWLGNEDIKVFKYENLTLFNNWLSTDFGIDTSQLEHINSIEDNKLSHIDFTDKEFITLIENKFYEDFIAFDYPLTYIKQ